MYAVPSQVVMISSIEGGLDDDDVSMMTQETLECCD
jgi:hypothetical protein